MNTALIRYRKKETKIYKREMQEMVITKANVKKSHRSEINS